MGTKEIMPLAASEAKQIGKAENHGAGADEGEAAASGGRVRHWSGRKIHRAGWERSHIKSFAFLPSCSHRTPAPQLGIGSAARRLAPRAEHVSTNKSTRREEAKNR
jgi:hypothetical protein